MDHTEYKKYVSVLSSSCLCTQGGACYRHKEEWEAHGKEEQVWVPALKWRKKQ